MSVTKQDEEDFYEDIKNIPSNTEYKKRNKRKAEKRKLRRKNK